MVIQLAKTIIGKQRRWIFGREVTIGTILTNAALTQFPNLNRAKITPGQNWIEDAKATGYTVPTIGEIIADDVNPAWNPETSLWIPEMGYWVALLTQNWTTESGAGPFIQSVQPDINDGKGITYGESAPGLCVKEVYDHDVSANERDIAVGGGIIDKIDISIGQTGRVRVTLNCRFMTIDDENDGRTSTTFSFYSGADGTEVLARNVKYHIKPNGGSAAPLYSEEFNCSLMADVVAKRYGGYNGYNVYKWVYNGWSMECTFKKPIVDNTEKILNQGILEGGDDTNQYEVYVYHGDLATYDESSGSWSAGEFRLSLKGAVKKSDDEDDDEAKESITLTGAMSSDGSDHVFQWEQASSGSQGWAT